jgi:CheY-like chemotaxis protein/CHASE3 domain sensor protein
MNSASDPKIFKQILARNVMLPLALAGFLSIVFVGIILHLISIRKWVDHSDQVIAKGHLTLLHTVDAETGLRGFLLTGKENFLEPYHWSVDDYDAQMKDFMRMTSDNPAQVELLKTISEHFHDWNDYAVSIINVKREGKTITSLVTSERGKQKMDEMRREFAEFIRNEETLRDERNTNSEDSIRIALTIVILASLFLGISLAMFSRRQLLTLSNDYKGALDTQLAQNAELQEQEWLQSGQTKLAAEMRGEKSVEKITSQILSQLAHYVDASVGVLYIADDAKRLHRMSTYAYSPPKQTTDTKSHGSLKDGFQGKEMMAFGQSLIGQAAAENRTMNLSDVPADYTEVSSGLGSAKPAQLLIVPMASDSGVQAVVEFGFIKPASKRVVQLLEQASESVALAIRSAQYREKLQNLLEESQRQAEELQVQQEELKVNNEELEEQSRALKESQVRLETQQAELEQINSQLEEQTQRLETQADELNERNRDLDVAREGLEQKANELEISSQYKSQFLANMSHELRTPLNSTLILAQLLQENKAKRLSNDEVEYAKTILASSNDLLTLINDILDLSKVEAGKIDLNPEKITADHFLQSMKRLFTPLAESRGIQFNLKMETPVEIETDQQRVEQILKNLISNAMKFTEKGAVTLAVTQIKTPAGKAKVHFAVTDTGIGITKEQQGVIFEAFRQADGTTNRRFGGTGLGLTISRDLAKLLGGTIEVTSQEGKGSTFTLVLPQNYHVVSSEPAEESHARSTPEASRPIEKSKIETAAKKIVSQLNFKDDRESLGKGVKVLLVVEDDQNFAKILYDLSREMEFNCLVAITAEEGIEMAETFLPNAVILDMNLPDHSGLAVLDHLKDNPKTRHIPVHIVSGQDSSAAAYQMGAIGYTLKPVPRDELKSAIEKLQSKLTQEFKHVLVVEDNAVQRDAICRLIADDQVKTTAVESGKEAMDALDQQIFDCMIVDLSLPDISGFELLEKVSRSKSSFRLPVIVYTGRDITRKEEDQLKKYSNTIIIKGARSPERLLSEVTLFLHQVESKMPADRQKILRELRDREKIFESRQILLVDDDVRNIFALSSALEGKGATVITARNGIEAVNEVKRNPDLDLVLMDIMMPEMDGYEAMRVIRNDPKKAKLPIIAVTAKAMPDDQRKCIEAGANDYLSKPIDLSKLLSLIRVWMPQETRKS